MGQCAVSIQFPFDSLIFFLYLLNILNSSDISLVEIDGYTWMKEKSVKKKKKRSQVYRNDISVLLVMEKEVTSSVIPSFPSLSKKEYC